MDRLEQVRKWETLKEMKKQLEYIDKLLRQIEKTLLAAEKEFQTNK